MTSIQTSIVKAYEELHLSVEDICAEWDDFDAAEIKMVLSQFSSIYRKAIKDNKEIGFTEEQHRLALSGMVMLEQSTEDENLKFRIQRYIREDATGRRDAASKGLQAVMLPAFEFNEMLKKARLALEKTRAIEVGHLDVQQQELKPQTPAPLEKHGELVEK